MSKLRPVSDLKVVTFTIPNGQTTQGATGSTDALPFIDLTNYVLVGVEFPATITGTGLTLQVSNDTGVYNTYGDLATAPTTYVAVYQGSGVVTITKQNSSLVLVDTTFETLTGVGKYLQFVSQASEGAKRTFKAYLVPR